MSLESGRNPAKRLFPGELRSRRGIASARKERERQGMKEIARKKFIGGMAATEELGWRGTFAAFPVFRRNSSAEGGKIAIIFSLPGENDGRAR